MTQTQRQILVGIVLGLLGFAANWFKLELFFGIDLQFGSIFVMLALLLYGGIAGIIAGVIAAGCTWFQWYHPWAFVSFVGETLFVAWWLRRKSRDVITPAIIYWLCLGAPIVWCSYHFLLDMPAPSVILVILKQAVNGIINALAATIMVQVIRLRACDSDELLSLRQLFATTIMAFVLFPALIYQEIEMLRRLQEEEGEIVRLTAHTAARSRDEVRQWLDNHYRDVDPTVLRPLLLNLIESPGQKIFLVDRSDRVIVASRPETKIMEPYRRPTGWTIRPLAEGVFQWVPRPDHVPNPIQRWLASRYVRELSLGSDLPWRVIIETSPAPMLQSLSRASAISFSLMLVLLVVTVSFSRLVSGGLVRPLRRLQDVGIDLPRQLAREQTAIVWPESEISEIRGLIVNFRKMAEGMARYVHELRTLNETLEERVAVRTASLQEKTAFLTALLTSMPDLVFFKDRDSAYLGANMNLARLFGRTQEEMVGVKDDDLYAPEMARQFRNSDQIVLNSGTMLNFQDSVTLPDGSHFEAETVKAPLALPTGEVIGLVGITRDITERYRHEQELIQARAAAETASRAKSMFLATMSHELRTPLNAILGLSEMLREGIMGDLTPGQQKSLATIEESGRHLLGIITDILDLTNIEADRMELAITSVSVADICRASLLVVEEEAQRKLIDVSLTLRQAPELMSTDPRRFKQILLNLLGNAVKFTPKGGKIGLEVVGDEARRRVRLTVWDTGIGIAHADLEKLFHPFVQVDDRLSRHYEGTGIGLALVARLTELLGGKVTVESEPEKGSRFTVILPTDQ